MGQNEFEYAQIAIQLANDDSLLRYLNKNLRTIMQQSILTDGTAFTRQFERLIRQSLEFSPAY